MNIILKNIIRFVVLVLIQVAILNNIQVSGFVNPYMYILFILLLPFEIPNWLLLVLSFFWDLVLMFSAEQLECMLQPVFLWPMFDLMS
jgi:hypothetical protein